MDIIISNHGMERLIERTKCKRSQAASYIRKIWETGRDIKSYSCDTAVYQYLKNAGKSPDNDRAIRVKGNVMYLFNAGGTVFITCFELPQKVIQNKRKRSLYK